MFLGGNHCCYLGGPSVVVVELAVFDDGAVSNNIFKDEWRTPMTRGQSRPGHTLAVSRRGMTLDRVVMGERKGVGVGPLRHLAKWAATGREPTFTTLCLLLLRRIV